jgi:hypothetical protein
MVRTEGEAGPDAASSAEHRRKLEALFAGSGANKTAPGQARPTRSGRVFSSPRRSVGRGPSEYRLRLERLRVAREPDEIKEAADAFLAYHQLPDDADILFKVLQHPAEKVVREALGQISALLMQNRFGGTLLLKDHLVQLARRATEDATHSYIDGLRAQIAQIDSDG